MVYGGQQVRNPFLAAGITLLGMSVSRDAHAYIDPGTGTILIQWLFGLAIAGLGAITLYWQRAKQYLSRRFRPTASGRDMADDPEIDTNE